MTMLPRNGTAPVFRLCWWDRVLLGAEEMGGTEPQLADEIRKNLRRILNSRRVSSSLGLNPSANLCLGAGLPDFAQELLEERARTTCEKLARVVREAIQLSEPRLKGLRVTVEPGNWSSPTRFTIKAKIAVEPEAPLGLIASLEPDGTLTFAKERTDV